LNHLKILVGIKHTNDIHGVLKSSPVDFVVDELPLYEPCGEGEHLYLRVRKSNMSHEELIRQIAKVFGVSKRDVGIAGRKDLKAVTSQMVSVYLPTSTGDVPDVIGTIDVLESTWHTNKLRLGHLSGNRFSIRLREIDSQYHETISIRLQQLAKTGLPNAFGPQRFGNYGNNHTLGIALILEDWDGLIDELLRGEERHHLFALSGDYKHALDAWPFGQPAERNILEALSQGKTKQQACKTVATPLRTLWVNAFQSSVFNEVLRQRHFDGTWNTILDGELVWNHEGGGRTFIASPEDFENPEFQDRIASFSISPSGPLWGAKMRMPVGQVLALEASVLDSFGVNPGQLASIHKMAKGARRPLRVAVTNQELHNSEDDAGEFLELKFELPAGSYATVVIDQLLRDEL
jgi:tRNA pseudouridine13 synthase